MEQFIIKPLSGANHLRFGKLRDEVIEDFQAPTEEEGRTDYYELESLSLALSYDQNDKLEFIEFGKVLNGTPVILNDIDVFNVPASELIQKITKLNDDKFNPENSEPPFTYTFNNIEIALDRPTSPDDYEDTAEDKDGYEHGVYFRSIGIGEKGYFSSTEMVD